MAGPVAARRLEIFAAARARPAEFLRFDPARLRFSLGTSLSDLQIPVEVAPEAAALVRAAAAEIALLLATRHKRFVPGDELDRLFLREDYASLPTPAPSLGPSGGGPDLRAAAQLGAAVHPALTGGIVCAWMGPGGRGRSLTALWIEALRRGFEEMAAARGREETPLVVALALAAEVAGADGVLREALPGPPLDRYFRAAAVSALWIAARTGLVRACRNAGRSPADPLVLRLEALLSPAAVLGGRGAVAGGGSTLYGVELSAGIPRADELAGRLAQGGDPDAVSGDLAAALASDDELSRRAEHASALARIRELLADAVVAAEAAGGAGLDDLRDLYGAPGALAAALGDDGSRRQLALRLASLAEAAPGDAAEAIAGAVKRWKARDPGASVGLDRGAGRARYAEAATALFADGAIERMLGPARRALSRRTGAESEGGAEAEYEAGRLYRISTRDAPILRAPVERPLGHLFADVKDFTRRTGLLGQAAMAEFLRREFYVPILSAAKRHFTGMGHLADRGGVAVNNLLGDAISFSGGIEAMVALAQDIRRHLEAYASRLAREVSSEQVARHVALLEERTAPGIAEAARQVAEAREALAAAAPGTREQAVASARLARARALEEARLAERDRAVARARGEGLEAGVFISHGAAPLVVTLDDEVFGKNRVAIAEKITESARGTARAAAARARADALLAAERASRGNPALDHAWSVFIGQPLAIQVPPDAEAAAVRAARAGDLPAALRALAVPVRDAVESAARTAGEPAGDVYNSGAALSEEALLAFIDAVGAERVVRRVDLEPAEIPEQLRSRWLFGTTPEALVVAFHRDGRVAEMFRRVGRASFKGLGEVRIWELCADAGGPGALARALGPRWFRSPS